VLAIYLLLIFSLWFREINLGLFGSGFGETEVRELVCLGATRTITDPFFYIYRFVSPLLVLLTSVVFSYEHETGILRSLMLKPVKKTTVFLAKLAYLILTASLVFVVAVAIYLVLLEPTAFIYILSSQSFQLSMIMVGLHYIIMFFMIISVATFLSIMIKKTSLSAGVSIAALYMLDYIGTIATSLRATLPPWSIFQSLYNNVTNIFFPSPIGLGPILNIILASIVLLALSWLIFGKVTEYE
jgi:hypothetical protein